MCVCVCVWERERESESERVRERNVIQKPMEKWGDKQPNSGDSNIKLWRYDPETGNRLYTRNITEGDYGLGAFGVVAAYDNGFLITSSTLIKTDSLGLFGN